MKIQTKTALLFTGLTAAVFLVLSISVYYFSIQFTNNDFLKRLELRARISAKFRFEQEEVSTESFKEIQRQYLEKLPNERAFVVEINPSNGKPLGTVPAELPARYLKQIFTAQGNTAYHRFRSRHYAGLLYKDESGHFLVIKSATNNYGTLMMEHLRDILIISFVLSVLIIYTVGRYFSKKAFKPFREITARVQEISDGNLHLRLPAHQGADEIAELTQTFNLMLDRLETAFETQNNFISNASHELRTPLTAIIGEADYALSRQRSVESYQNSLQEIIKQAEKLKQLTKGLLGLAQTGFDGKKQQWEPVRIDQLIFDVKENIDSIMPNNHLEILIGELPREEKGLIVQGNYDLLKIAVSNIVLNGIKYSNNKKVTVKMQFFRKHLNIIVTDAGIGIPAQELKHIYDPFFRASNTITFEGYGIGMPLSNNIIRLHGGKIDVQSQEKMGTSVKISLPLPSK